MPRKTTILLSLALLAFLCFQAQTFSFFEAHSLRNTLMNAHATTSGIIELKKDYSIADSFYVEADLSYNPYSSSNSSNSTNNSTNASETVRMMLSLSNSETLVTTGFCYYFNRYDCSQYSSCYQYSWNATIDYPSFTAFARYARGDVYLDYNYWSLPSAYLYIAQTCQSNADSSTYIGYNRYGVIGLGTEGAAGADFLSNKMFSISINSDLNSGTLLFKSDTSKYAQSSSPVYTLYANASWQVPISSGYLQVGYSSVSVYGNLMFDINTDAIGLPYNTYRSFISYFTQASGANCGWNNYKPTCYSTKKIKDLPDITLTFDSVKLVIPPQLYASSVSEGYSFTLNFKATSPSLSGKSYITPSFQNSIILDANFLSYYYGVFDATSTGYNIIYLYNSKNASPGQNTWVAVGAAAVVFLVALCCCCAKKKKNVTSKSTTLNNTNVIYAANTTQAPLIYNPQGVNNTSAPSYSYDANIYNYAGYNGAQQPQGMYPAYNTGYQQPQGIVYAPPGYIQPDSQEPAKQ